ncbi:hypothetical protein [uncultured Pluralibacter sp.]|uniref:hypothetical protein n=1 Tax=uncultured Pluralibacter sp. TaxID=1490864 RepID=UPI00261B7638|nr:hypothetical protein [uncultured Pluralibacter sp.]
MMMVIPPSQPNRRRRPVLVKLEKCSFARQAAGLFPEVYMSANELALRFSSAPAEQLIGVLPVLEVKEALREEVEDDVLNEVWQEHQFEMDAVEEQADEANRLASKFELVAEAFGTAIKQAVQLLPNCEVKTILNDALEEHPGYGRDPQ